jgi:hypothetical protein
MSAKSSLEKHDYRIQRLVNKIKRTTRTETYKEFMADQQREKAKLRTSAVTSAVFASWQEKTWYRQIMTLDMILPTWILGRLHNAI